MGTVVHGWPRSQRETFEPGDIERPDSGGQTSECVNMVRAALLGMRMAEEPEYRH